MGCGLKLALLEMEGSLETIKNYVAAYTTRYDGVKYAAAAELKEELRSVHGELDRQLHA